MSDVCGPWDLEGLDNFGTLDSLAFSLDDPIWNSADTCIVSSGAVINGQGQAQASANATRESQAQITGAGQVVAGADRTRTVIGIITGEGNFTGDALRIRTSGGAILGIGSLEAFAGLEQNVVAFALGNGEIIVTASAIRTVQAGISGGVALVANGYIYGEEWNLVPDEASSWTDVPETPNVWTQQQPGQNTWQQIG